jgi:hypothetical protein
MTKKSNIAKGRKSYDAQVGNEMIPFFNRNVSEYPTEAGGVKFELVPVEKQKDIMINHARIYAQQEYDRIMQIVSVLQEQAQQIKRRLEITDLVYEAEYHFQPVLGQSYWLVWDQRKSKTLLVPHGPNDWSSGPPVDYVYTANVKYMGDHTWMELNEG